MTLYRPKHCLVPLAARLDKTLSSSAKLYLGELNVLTNKFGFCCASDEHLAEMQEVSLKTIKNWHHELEERGFIIRDTWREHVKIPDKKGLQIKSKRRIYINENPPTPGAKKCSIPEGQKTTLHCEGQKITLRTEGQKITPITIEPLKEEQQQQKEEPSDSNESCGVDVSFFKCLNNTAMDDDLKVKLTKKYPVEADVMKAVAVMRQSTRVIDSAYGWLDKCLERGGYSLEKKSECLTEGHKALLSGQLALWDGKTLKETQIVVGASYIEFVTGSFMRRLEAVDRDFFTHVQCMFKTLGASIYDID